MSASILDKIDSKILGERLKSARRALGLTQEAVADKLGFVRTTVVAIEKGERRVTADELFAFAKCYARNVSELVKQSAFTEALTPQFRAALPNSQLETPLPEDQLMRVCHELESRAEDYLELEQMCNAPLPKDYPKQYPLDDSRVSPEQFAEDVAQEERNRLGLGDAPISDLRAVFEEAVGLRVFFYEMPSSVAGIFGYNDRLGGCIGVSIRHPWYCGNWSLAHEYGHFLTTRFYADVDVMQKGRWGKHRAERFADCFAANFLMPRSGVNRRLSEVEMSRKERVTIADLVTLSDYFGVSVQAMCLRLENLKRIQTGSWERLRAGDFKPDKARQALGLLRSDKRHSAWPGRYLLLAKAAFEKGEISENQLAKKLRVDIVSAREIMQELDSLVVSEEGEAFSIIPVDLESPVSSI
jgi:Zn-dependent peptidase ImmA (M78 family)/transcriptional regulator with XRE-family HTH domain